MNADDLRAEAEQCRQSAQNNGGYNDAFWVAAVVLERLAIRMEALSAEAASPADAQSKAPEDH